MSEEMSTPRHAPSNDASDGDLAGLRREVIEARNLIIKTDNLLKNLHVELKNMGTRAKEQEARQWRTSVAAYLAAVVLCAVFAVLYSQVRVSGAREELAQNETRTKQLQSEAEKIKAQDQARRDVSEKAFRVFELLGSEKEGAGLNQAMSQAVRLDRSLMTPLEAKAIDDRAAGMKSRIAQAALDRGTRAFRQQDWHTAAQELGRYLELEPRSEDPLVYFHLGNARTQIKEWQGAIQPLEAYLKAVPGTKTSQFAGLLLGESYEETGNTARAREVYERAVSLYPGSDFAPALRSRIRRLGAAAAAAPAAPAPSPTR